MKLVAFGKNKESLPFTLSIEIQPVNDEVPRVTTNTGLQMWVGGKSVLRNSDLCKLRMQFRSNDKSVILNFVT